MHLTLRWTHYRGVGVDVIVLQNGETRELISTEFLVRFEFTLGKSLLCSSMGVNRTADWKVTSLSYSKSFRPPADDVMGGEYTPAHSFNRIGPIEVYVNDVHCPNVHVTVQDFEESTVHFLEPGGAHTTSPSHHILKEMNIRKGTSVVSLITVYYEFYVLLQCDVFTNQFFLCISLLVKLR